MKYMRDANLPQLSQVLGRMDLLPGITFAFRANRY
jgi:hypothetical protein